MKYKAFEIFGVEVFKMGQYIETVYFDKLANAVMYQRYRNRDTLYLCQIITADKYGNKIDEL